MFITLNIYYFKNDIGRIYFADLLGAGVGCLLAILFLDLFGGISGLLIVPAIGAFSALLIAYKMKSKARILVAAAIMILSLFAATKGERSDFFAIKYAKGRALPAYREGFETWSPIGRVRANKQGLSIDEGVRTTISKIRNEEELEPLWSSVLTSVYHIRQGGNVVIIGSGGGIDIWRAHLAKSKKITAVEINPGIVELMTGSLLDFSGGVYALPEVEVHCDDGRHFVSHSEQLFDVIQVSFVDTYTAAGTESSILSENSLYTVEAFDEYWQHLKSDGILTFARWAGRSRGMCETERVTVLAANMLLRHGIKEPWKHIVVLRNPRREDIMPGPGYLSRPLVYEMAVVLVKKSPFEISELSKLKVVAETYKQRPLFIPNEDAGLPRFKELAHVTSFDELNRITEARYRDEYFDLSPPTDDKPYFFSMLRPLDFTKMVKKFPGWRKSSLHTKKYMGIKILKIVITVLVLLAIVFVLGPLFIRVKRISNTIPSLFILAYFSLLGLGFIFIEISAINQFALLLGHPTYALAIGLFSILVFAGLGSLAFSKITIIRSYIIPLLITVLSLISWIVYPMVIESFMHFGIFGSSVVAIICLAPLCFTMGMALPLGVDLLSDKLSDTIPWAFALNGVFSVTGSAFSMALSLQSGFGLTFLIGAICYGVATIVIIFFSKAAGLQKA
ncbi:MAG: hypothetical protein GY847_10050 [Proteobacteria bacterium]|nr:hypothetical protein [Pseudomonadota bacterium]